MKNKKGLIPFLLSGILLFTACSQKQEDKTYTDGSSRVDGISYVTLQATYEDLVHTENITATYKATSYVDLRFGLEGKKIKALEGKRGDIVEKGQLLGSLDMGDVDGQLNDMEHELASLNLKLEQTLEQKQFELDAAYILFSYGSMEAGEKEALKEEQANIEKQYRNLIEDLEDDIAVTQTRLNENRSMVEKGRIYAPFRGELTYVKSVKEGDLSKESENLITISSLSDCYFAVSGTEYKDYFQSGETYQIQCAVEGKYYVYNILPVHIEKWEESGEMQFQLADNKDLLNLGMVGTISVNLGEKKNVLCLPRKVIHQSNDEKFVYVLEEGQRKMKYIQTGLTVGGKTEIMGGITQQDLVIVDQSISEEQGQKEGAANEE